MFTTPIPSPHFPFTKKKKEKKKKKTKQTNEGNVERILGAVYAMNLNSGKQSNKLFFFLLFFFFFCNFLHNKLEFVVMFFCLTYQDIKAICVY